MKWSEVSIQTTRDAVEAVSNILHEAGAGGVVIEDPEDLNKNWEEQYGEIYELDPEDYPTDGVIVKAYLPVNDDLVPKIDQIRGALNQLKLHGFDEAHKVTLNEVNEDDWADEWKKYYKPTRITERLTITPTWETYEPIKENECIIELDPGMAFGTGTHPTTVLCLQMIEKYLTQGNHVLDVGTGSGVLSIAAAKLGAESVLAVDLDDVAVRVARENVKQNHVADKVTLQQNDLVKGLSGDYDLIVANILAEIILLFTDGAYSLLKSGGKFIASGIIKRKYPEVEQALLSSGFTIQETVEEEEWIAVVAQKL
ncbi:ribosomal protein L11 methyltransferase [Pullulanibacillus pueri]|uniref:Ribosomal protein L11 methyltransferase n=1 Tax=Pullulanibacillus pueri TaxID=1437324 RepID=A0A8J3EMX7_9BACL|nr:50S ribosomal protein L11 methyltransferase [Pullulanibacillus pueri]MBM7683057.1 ribosomal protein L11 methyltransferase [Pullulanibacillus pueri]GGH84937.1 ribosomal protein L11 methyltransferase [Pullulanibacillus pueri]